LVLELGHPEVGLFRYLVAPDPLLPRAVFPPPWEKKRREEESEELELVELELVESEIGKSNFLGCNYFLGFDCFELVENWVVELDELQSEDGVQHFPNYSLLRLQKHMLEYYLDNLKHCHRWQDTSSKGVDHHK
ncbi:hypothetical protein Tco_0118995, partial [Tanacetum coccineum]